MMVSNRIPSFTWRNYEFNIYIIAPKQPEYDPKFDLTICKSVRKFGYAYWDTISFKFSIYQQSPSYNNILNIAFFNILYNFAIILIQNMI